MDTHVKILGVLSLIFGLAATAASLLATIWFGGIGPLYQSAEDVGFGFVAVTTVLAHLILGPPFAIAGFFVMRFHEWARATMIVLCGLNLLNIPFGSAVAIYGLWVLLSPETEPLFREPPRVLRTR